MQFGFKADMSTTLCTYVMMETVSYYNAQCSNVYALMLDASKAFDRVNYGKLFRILAVTSRRLCCVCYYICTRNRDSK